MTNLRVGIDGRLARRGGQIVERSLDGIRTAAGRLEFRLRRTRRGFDSVRASAFRLSRVLVPLFSILAARQLGQLANTFQEINNRLRLVTDSSEQLTAVQERVFTLAQRNRIAFEATAELFQRVARSSEQLGLSLEDVLEVTDLVAKAITLSGVSAQSANAAIVQLGQGLAAGALRGDELRSVLEQTPRLARAIADGLGVPIGKLRELGAAGKLSAEAVITALRSQAEVLRVEFGETIPTISQAFNILRNSLVRTVGIFGESTGAAGGFASIIIKLAGFIQGPLLQGLLSFGDLLGVTFQELGLVINRTSSSFQGLGVDIVGIAGDIGRSILRIPLTIARFINRTIVELVNGIAILKTRIDSFFNDVVASAKRFQNILVGTIATAIGDDAVAEQAAAAFIEIEQGRVRERLRLEEQLNQQLATLEADRELLIQNEVAREEQLTDAINQRAEARLQAAQIDLTQASTPRKFIDFSVINDDLDKLKTQIGKTREDIDQFAVQAARNAQDAFAEFFFDPFEDGLRGLVKGFIDAIRRLLANKLAQQLFSVVGGEGGFLSGFFGGERAFGGPVNPGQAFLVGERGPELFVPPSRGNIIPNNRMGGNITISNVIQVDARADREQIIAELAPLLEQASDATVNRVRNEVRRGTLV